MTLKKASQFSELHYNITSSEAEGELQSSKGTFFSPTLSQLPNNELILIVSTGETFLHVLLAPRVAKSDLSQNVGVEQESLLVEI